MNNLYNIDRGQYNTPQEFFDSLCKSTTDALPIFNVIATIGWTNIATQIIHLKNELPFFSKFHPFLSLSYQEASYTLFIILHTCETDNMLSNMLFPPKSHNSPCSFSPKVWACPSRKDTYSYTCRNVGIFQSTSFFPAFLL